MKLWIEKDDGEKIEVREIETPDAHSEILFFFCQYALRPETVREFETELEGKIGKKCVILDGKFHDKILAT